MVDNVAAQASAPAITSQAEFEAWADLPENRDRHLEYLEGSVIEVVSNENSGAVTGTIILLVGGYVKQHDLGLFTVPDNGFRFGANNLMPDFAFISKVRRSKPQGETWITAMPNLVVEVKSPTDTFRALSHKALVYLEAGVTLVWLVFPEKRQVTVYTQDGVQTLDIADTLDGGEVLPGFSVSVAEIFASLLTLDE